MEFVIKYIGLIILIITLSSCTANIKVATRDQGFTFDSIQRDKILFGGFIYRTDNWSNWSEYDFLRYSKIAQESLSFINNEIVYQDNLELIKKLSISNYLKSIRLESEKENITTGTLSRIKEALPNTRYIIFSYLTNDKSSKSSYKDKGNIIYSTDRAITISTVVYDLTKKTKVWKSTIETSGGESNSNPHSHNDNIFKDLIITSIEEKIYETHPADPGLEGLIKKSFSNIGDRIANKSCDKKFIKCMKRKFRRARNNF